MDNNKIITTGEWISTKEKMPEKSDYKIIYIKVTFGDFLSEFSYDGYVTIGYYSKSEGLWIVNNQPYCANIKDVNTNEVDYVQYWMDLPSFPIEEKFGRWIRKENDYSWWIECSECGTKRPWDEWGQEWESPFCPNCGIKMKFD